MQLSRRRFISSTVTLGIIGKHILKSETDSTINKFFENNEISKVKELVYPLGLQKGAKIAITAIASPTSMGEIASCIRAFKYFGCSVEVGKTITQNNYKYRYLSNSDIIRANEFMEFIKREDINAIIIARGGYGSLRILPYLDYELIRQSRKIIMGFSDITALINAIYTKSKLVTYHGPVASNYFNNYVNNNIYNTLFQNQDLKFAKVKMPNMYVINKGFARGKLIGGNLTMISSLLGTEYEIDTTNSILFLEEVSEQPYKIDRMLTQLWLAGKLQSCNGIFFGYIKNLDSRHNFFPGLSFTVRQIIESRLKPIGIPCFIGFPFGHTDSNYILPIGIDSSFNTKTKSFEFIESPVYSNS